MDEMRPFRDRRDAGRQLAEKLKAYAYRPEVRDLIECATHPDTTGATK
jgi:predicted phosphoribosyltransferase